MNDEFPQRQAPEQPSESTGQAPLTSGQQRRHLLRTVAATGAVVGVGLPLSAHATIRPHCKKANDPTPTNNYHPTASAVGSMVGSTTGGTLPICGHTTGHYCGSGGWTGGTGWSNCRPTSVSLTYNTCANSGYWSRRTFNQVFEVSSPSTAQARECWNIINNYSTSDEAIWLTAMFNANKRGSLFPYSPSQVFDLYKGVNPIAGGTMSGVTIRDKALILFRDYLSQGVV